MRYDNLEQEKPAVRNNDKRTAALSALFGGTLLVGAAAFGFMSNEAETPQEALGSINMGEHTYFVETEEIPFAIIGGVGLIAVAASIETLRRKDEE